MAAIFATPLFLAGLYFYKLSKEQAPLIPLEYRNNTSNDADDYDNDSVSALFKSGSRLILSGTIHNMTYKLLKIEPPVNYDHMVEKTRLSYLIKNIRNEDIVPSFRYDRGGYVVLKKDQQSHGDDPHREIKDACTNIVTKLMLNNEETLFNFMNLVVTTVNKALDEYMSSYHIPKNAIMFFYKGGNVFKLISTTFFSRMPYRARMILEDFYMPFFSRSDSDFELYVNPLTKNADQIHKDCGKIIYMCGVYIRNVIEADPSKYINFFKYSHKEQQEILSSSQALDPFINAKSFKNTENEVLFGKTFTGIQFLDYLYAAPSLSPWQERPNDYSLSGRRDFMMQNKLNDDNMDGPLQPVIFPVSSKIHTLFCYINDTLNFTTEHYSDLLQHFGLFRIKLHFTLYLDGEPVSSAGELLDISYPYIDDYKALRLSKLKNLDEVFHTYSITSGSKSLKFTSYTVGELGYDIIQVLFFEHDPWNVNKYHKRLHRCMFLVFTDLIAIVGLSSGQVHQLYLTLQSMFHSIIEHCTSRKSIIKHIEPILKVPPTNTTVMHNMFTMLFNLFNDNENIVERSSLATIKEFFELILIDIDLAIKVCEEIGMSCNTRILGKSSLYSMNLNQLLS
jgi:hypothetical protein